jgi:hypothetical protein
MFEKERKRKYEKKEIFIQHKTPTFIPFEAE